MSRTLALSDLREEDRARFGGKAVQLGRLARSGLPVPPGFALCFGSHPSSRLSEDERAQVRWAYTELGRGVQEPTAVAVRSSAVGEDGAEFSFAGLFTSRLDVEGADAVCEAVAECLASQESEPATAYREEAGAGIAGRAVVIQRMVPADYAGVCFTRSPSEEDEVVVELVSGLAEGLAAGTRTPARVCFAREGLEVRSSDDAADLLRQLGVEAVREVARLALRAEEQFGFPLDVEWAASEGRVQLVQARPITARTRLARAEQIRREEIERLARGAGKGVRVWSDFSVGDMFTRPAPLDLEILRCMARRGRGLDRALRRIGLHPADPETHATFETICGRVYLSLDGLIKGADEDVPLAVDASRLPSGSDVGLDPLLAPFRLVWPGWRGLLRIPALLLRLARAAFRLRGLQKSLAREFQDSVEPRAREEAVRLRHRDLASLSDPELWEALRSHVDRIADLVYYHQLSDIVSIALHQLLRIRLALLYGGAANPVEMRLLTALPGNLNTETNLDLARVARGELTREAFLERYGHRGNPDWQISAPRWREHPARIEQLLQVIERAERDPIAAFEKQKRVRAEAERNLAAEVQRRWWMRPFHASIMRDLRDLQRYSPLRETTQGLCYLFVELARAVALEAARRSGLGELVFFFTLSELQAWLVEGPSPELRARAGERRRRLRVARRIFVPHVVRSDALDAIGRSPPLPASASTLQGQVVASGVARGRARVAHSLEEAQDLEPGEILVTAATDPAWTPLFLVAGGAVLEQGGLLSHPAIVAREYGLPAVVNVAQATRILHTGQLLTVDADRGTVVIHDDDQSSR